VNRAGLGQSLTEYGLIGALVALASIGALVVLGGSLSDALQNLWPQATPQITQTAGSEDGAIVSSMGTATHGAQSMPSPIEASGAKFQIGPPNANQEQICFQNGMCVNIPIFPPSSTVETIGTNGSEFILAYADVLQQIADQLRQDPNADSSLVATISDLANRGHDLGRQEQEIASLKKQNISLNYSETGTILSAKRKEMEAAQLKLADHLGSHPDALPPALTGLIDESVVEILGLAKAYHQYSFSYSSPKPEFGQYIINMTRWDANTICNTGGEQCIVQKY